MVNSKSQAIAMGVMKLKELTLDFDFTVKVDAALDSFSQIDESKGFWEMIRLVEVAKGFIDYLYGEDAPQIVAEFWDDNCGEFFYDFWQKPDSEVLQRIAAVQWANSSEGISDLRRFWHVRPQEVTTDELKAYQDNLPTDSASAIAYSEFDFSIDRVLDAAALDSFKMLMRQNAGKGGRLPDGQSMVNAFKRTSNPGGPQAALLRELAEAERQHRREQDEKARENRRK